MSLVEIARIYVDLVILEGEIPDYEHQAKERVNVLRSRYHELLMARMREEGVEFSDRFDAANKAFDLIRGEKALHQ